MRINRFVVPILAISVIALAVVIAQVTGDWVTSGKQLVDEKVAAGELTADDIRGWMTLQEVADYFDMPLGYLYKSLGLEEESFDPQTELRELEDTASLETEDVRETARRFQAGEPAALVVENSEEEYSAVIAEEHSQPELGSNSSTADIKGRMTLKEVADAFGLSTQAIIETADLPADIDVSMPLRDLKTVVNDFEVSMVRDAVDELIED